MADTSTTELISTAYTKYQANVENANKIVTENNRKAEEATAKAITIYEQAALDKAAIARQSGIAELQAQNARRGILAAGGVNPTTGEGSLLELIRTSVKKQEEAMGLMSTIREKNESSFFDNPIKYVKDAFTVYDDKEKLEGTAQELQLINTSILATNNALQQTTKTIEAGKESLTAATIESASRVAASEAQLRAEEARIQGLKFNSENIISIKNASQEQIVALYNLQSSQLAEKNYNLALKRFDSEDVQRNFAREQIIDAKEAKTVGKLADEITLEKINIGRRSLGLTDISPLEVKTQLELYKRGDTNIAQFHAMGERVVASGIPLYGATPTKALDALNNLPTNLPTIIQETAKTTQEIIDQVKKTPAFKSLNKDSVAQSLLINEVIKSRYSEFSERIKPGMGNPLDIGDLKSFIGTPDAPGIIAFQGLAVTRVVLNDAIKAGHPLSNPKDVTALVLGAVMKGELTTAEAASGLATIYQRAAAIHQQSKNFLGFGIVLPLNGKTYRADFDGGVIDMTSFTAVGTYMNRALAIKQDNPFTGGRRGGTATEMRRNLDKFGNADGKY